jgi:hypothetical protein
MHPDRDRVARRRPTGSGEASYKPIANNGVVLTGALDDSMLYVAATTGAARASGLALAEVFSHSGPGYARLFGGVSYTDVDVVGS